VPWSGTVTLVAGVPVPPAPGSTSVTVPPGGTTTTACCAPRPVPIVSTGEALGRPVTGVTAKDRVSAAARWRASPACLASRVQVPSASNVTVPPDATAQISGVVASSVTGSPEVDVAVIVRVPAASDTSLGCGNVIVWFALRTPRLTVTGTAAR
jgi:hypothetical protein